MLHNLKLRIKILLGFGFILFLLLIISVWGIFALRQASLGFNRYREIAIRTNLVGRLQANMLMSELALSTYIKQADQNSLNEFDKHWDMVNDFMKQAQQQIKNPERVRLLNEANENLSIYHEEF
jgi:methyl-accepting chemotaxis protein